MKSLLILLLVTFLPSVSYANLNDPTVFRCGNNIASVGDAAAELIQKCGQPTYTIGNGEWVYDQGPSEFIHIIYVSRNGINRIRIANEHGTAVKSYSATK